MRTDEDRNLLATGSDSLNEGIVGSIRPVHSISNEGSFNDLRVEFDDRLARGELRT
jgi:formate dehydrogenase assembly factor FdhD